MTLIKAKELAKFYYGDGVVTKALREASFEINKGEFVAIMGPSGSGKSTLLHILGLLERQTSGTYWLEEKETSEYNEDEIARIRNKKMGFVFQTFNLLGRTSVYENTQLPLLYSDTPESEWDALTHEAIESVGLDHRAGHEPAQLSGGERQRAAIARALVNKPEIIFADEPTGNLDSASGEMVMGLMQEMHQNRGHTVVLITHETYTAEYAERVIHLADGIVQSDQPVTKRRVGKGLFQK